MSDEFYALTDDGRKIGYVLSALYKANRFLTASELIELSGQDETIVVKALAFFQEMGQVVRHADGRRYELLPEARFVIRDIEIRMGKDFEP